MAAATLAKFSSSAERHHADQRAVGQQRQVDQAVGAERTPDLAIGGRGLGALEVGRDGEVARQRRARAQAAVRIQRNLEPLQGPGDQAGAGGRQHLALRLQQQERDVPDAEQDARGLLQAQQQVGLAVHVGQVQRQRLQRGHRHRGGLQRRVVLVHRRRRGGVRQFQRDPQRHGLLARRLVDVERQRERLHAQQGLVVQRIETRPLDADQALHGLQVDAPRSQLGGADGVRAPQQEPEAVEARGLVGRQVVEQDGVGHQRRQLPLVDEPGADRAVVGV